MSTERLYVSVDDINPNPLIPLSTIYQELLYVTLKPGDVFVSTDCGACQPVASFRSQRELVSGFRFSTVRELLAAFVHDPTSYTTYRRDFTDNTIETVLLTDELGVRDSIVAILPDVVTIERYMEFVSTHPELIPTREV